MEIDPTLSIIAAAIGGMLIGWQLRADVERRRTRRTTKPQSAEAEVSVDKSVPRVPIHTPEWQRPVLTEVPKE